MAADRRHVTSRRRYGQRRRVTPPPAVASQAGMTLDHILTLPVVDRVLGRLLNHPRALQAVGILIGIVIVVLALRPLFMPSATATAPTQVTAPASGAAGQVAPFTPDPQTASSGSADQEVLRVVAAYNQASITAAVLNRADVMAPYLAPDGKTWTEVQAEYQRRTTRGETHDPALTRWGVLRIAVDGDSVMVETLEQWDDVTSVGGEVVSSRRGILTRNVYELRRSPSMGRWLIKNVTTTVVIG